MFGTKELADKLYSRPVTRTTSIRKPATRVRRPIGPTRPTRIGRRVPTRRTTSQRTQAAERVQRRLRGHLQPLEEKESLEEEEESSEEEFNLAAQPESQGSELARIAKDDTIEVTSLMLDGSAMTNNSVSSLNSIIRNKNLMSLKIKGCIKGIACILVMGAVRNFLMARPIKSLTLKEINLDNNRYFAILEEGLEFQVEQFPNNDQAEEIKIKYSFSSDQYIRDIIFILKESNFTWDIEGDTGRGKK